jgi:hypothetical protein
MEKRLRRSVPRKSREEEIIAAIRGHLSGAANGLESITDGRLMKAANCARATFYKYVFKGSTIEREIVIARIKQEIYAESVRRLKGTIGHEPGLRKRLEESESGNRELLAYISRMTANLIKYGIPTNVIQAAQQEAMPHPDRSFSHAGKGRRRK